MPTACFKISKFNSTSENNTGDWIQTMDTNSILTLWLVR